MPLFVILAILTIFAGGCQSEQMKVKPPVPYPLAAWGRCLEAAPPSNQSSIEFYLWNQSSMPLEVSLESLAVYKPVHPVSYNLKRDHGEQTFHEFKTKETEDPKLAAGDAIDVEFQTAASSLGPMSEIQIDLKDAQTSYQMAIPCRH